MKSDSLQDPIVSCTDPENIVGAINALMPFVPAELFRPFNRIKLTLLQRHGKVGLHARTNGRRVSEILATELQSCDREPLESGESNGVRYQLYESPEGDPAH